MYNDNDNDNVHVLQQYVISWMISMNSRVDLL